MDWLVRAAGAVAYDAVEAHMPERLLTPSKITAWLDCEHYLTLRHLVEEGCATFERSHPGAFARLLMAKGEQHERACLDDYRARGAGVFQVPPRRQGEPFAAWVDRVGDPLGDGHDVIFQMPFVHVGVRGIADFLVRVDDPDTGSIGYEPVDSKLARVEAKPGHVLQLCFYAEAIEAVTGFRPENLHVWLGSGRFETIRHQHVRPYWNRLRGQIGTLLDAPAQAAATVPEPCRHCAFCEFEQVCDTQWRLADSLIFVAGIRQTERAALETGGVTTLGALATLSDPADRRVEVRPERLDRLARQASLQVEAAAAPDGAPPYEIVERTDDPTWGRGFDLMPEPDDGDVFLDFEGHPFWRADRGLFFLLGYIARDDAGAWAYTSIWAHDSEGEAAATERLLRTLAARREAHPGMHVYHYNHTERSALVQLATTHGVCEALMDELSQTGLFVDLLTVVRNALVVGTESYGLKHVERLAEFERSHKIEAGSGAVVAYENFMADGDEALLAAIADYNEDDVRATRALRDWLLERRPADVAWRAATLDSEDAPPDLDEKVEALHAFGLGTPQHLLGDLLGYWLRERRANLAPKLGRLAQDEPARFEDPLAIAGLVGAGTFKPPRKREPRMRFSFPLQEVDEAGFGSRRAQVIFDVGDGLMGSAGVDRVDCEAGELDLIWNAAARQLGTLPTIVALDDWVSPRPKPAALGLLADRALDPETHGPANPVQLSLLRRDLPAFTPGDGPPGGEFDNELGDMTRLVCHLDGSTLAVQGPPGTGKTFRGARMVRRLVLEGRRVGITAMSHRAIENLVEAVVTAMAETGDLHRLRGIRRTSDPAAPPLDGVTLTTRNQDCADPAFDLVAGTSWLFSNAVMRGAPVDVLVIDEAGQFALVDALVASSAARNLVLLGDPLQLAQVTQASHPGSAGRSVLEHVLDGHVTMPAQRGIFLDVTRRMHPDVCAFISERIYEGRLASHPACAVQDTEWGTGLRWLRVRHEGRSTESVEEADAVIAAIIAILGSSWVDQHGTRAPLGAGDVMVVAPYNDQVDLLRARLDEDPRTAPVEVGTVDKFQGREAPVVFFTMTTSSAADMPRTSEFLFSQHRLNVAVSRARCLAILVSTEELLNTRARSVEEMRLVSTLCAFVEYATEWAGG